jgi:hypothetical protein
MVLELLPRQNQASDLPLAVPLPPYPANYDPGDDIGWSLSAFAARRLDYQLYDAYLRGLHRPVVATQAYEHAFRDLLARTAANVCPAVVRALTDRLKIVGFSPHDDTQDEASATAAWQFYQDRRLARVANYAHGRAVGLGDAYLVVWPDRAGKAHVYAHGGECLVARHDPEDPETIQVAARLWEEPPTREYGHRFRLTLYYADRVERYISGPNTVSLPTRADAFIPYVEPGQPATVRNPWGRVPVFPLAFEGGPGMCGHSALVEVVPLQDQLNKAVIDRAVAQEFGAWPQRYAIGLEPDYDADGNPLPRPVKFGVDRLVTIANPDAKFGQFDATELGPYTETIMSFLDLIATVTGIPPHLLHRGLGTPPSGEALKTAEARLVARVEDTQTDFGDTWEDAIGFALAIEGSGSTMVHVVTDWRPAVTRAELEHAQTVGLLVTQAGLPKTEAWKLLDYTEEQIAAMQAQDRADQAFSADLVAGDGSASLRAEMAGGNQGQGGA